MILNAPFFITSRLMAGVKVDGATLSIECGPNNGKERKGCTHYNIWVDLPDGQEFNVTDLRSGCQGGNLKEGMESLLSFLSAAGESLNYSVRTGRESENADLFPLPIVQWAAGCTDELTCLEIELQESPDAITY